MARLPPVPVPVARPGSTEGARSRPDLDPETDPRHFPCPRCGADLEYAIGKLRLACGHCGFERAIELGEADPRGAVVEQDYAVTLRRLEELRRAEGDALAGHAAVKCQACSAEVVFEDTVTSTECAYCGQPVQRDSVHTSQERIPVDGVLPFEIDKAEAQVRLSRWLRGLWFAPGEFMRRGLRGRFAGTFLPYWTFDSATFARYTGQRGDYYTVRVGSGKNARTERRIRWQSAAGSFQRFFDDVLALAVAEGGVPQPRRLEPWPFERLVPFRAELLAGFSARTYDRQLESGFEEARGRMEEALRDEARRRIGGDVQQLHHLDARYDAVTYKHLLLPVWLMSYRHGEQVYRVVINAVTGQVFGERPWSAWKILGAATLALVAVLLILLVTGRM
jgi:DNA-directed RNA polymerase subunit RPC12/RpoP